MRAWLLRLGDRLRESYWFIPSIMALAAMVLASSITYLDSLLGPGSLDGVGWLYPAHPDGARQLLSVIGGSMITVAGTVFSVTIAAVVYASGQYGPRLLSNFMSDRGNQITLGTFIATFLYCMLVLRTIRSPGDSGSELEAFVPQLSLLVAVLLVLCSIAVLIFFIHHVPMRIHINSVIEEVGERLLTEIEDRFPSIIGSPMEKSGEDAKGAEASSSDHRPFLATLKAGDGLEVDARRVGYIQFIDDEALMTAARDNDLVIQLQFQPGDFTHAGRVIAEAWPSDRCDENVADAIRRAFAHGSRRTALQDLRFLIDELVEIAARALSPGVNDPFTANTCLDWMGAALADIAGRQIPDNLRADENGALRIVGYPQTFQTFMDRAFGGISQYAATDKIAAIGFLNALGEVGLGCRDRSSISVVDTHARSFLHLVQATLLGASLQSVSQRGGELLRALSHPLYRVELRAHAAGLSP